MCLTGVFQQSLELRFLRRSRLKLLTVSAFCSKQKLVLFHDITGEKPYCMIV